MSKEQYGDGGRGSGVDALCRAYVQKHPTSRMSGGMQVNAIGPRHPKVRLLEKKHPNPTHADVLYPQTRKKP